MIVTPYHNVLTEPAYHSPAHLPHAHKWLVSHTLYSLLSFVSDIYE